MNMLTLKALEMSESFVVDARRSRKAAMNRARGYKRISKRPEEKGMEERWLKLIRKAVKTARSSNKLLISAKRFSAIGT